MSSALAGVGACWCWVARRVVVDGPVDGALCDSLLRRPVPATGLGCGRGLHGGAEGASFGLGDRVAVKVTQEVALIVAPAGGDAGHQDGREGAQRTVVVLAGGP